MELKPDIAFRSSDGTDPDRVRADIELLNQRMSVLAANIQTIAAAISDAEVPTQTVVEEKIAIAPGGGLAETEDGVRLDILGLPTGSSTASGWLVVEGEDGQLYRVPVEDFVTKPAIEDPNDVPTMAISAAIVSSSWNGSTTIATRDDLYQLAVNATSELNKIRVVMEPTLDLLRTIGSDGNG